MAVLTHITEEDARILLDAYGLGQRFRALVGVPAGSVNSNFALELDDRRLFLRLYEERNLAGARHETAMLERLAARSVPTPAPLRRLDGELVSVVHGKPAAVFPWRAGGMRCQASVRPEDVQRVGEALARVHAEGGGEVAGPGRFGHADLAARLDRIEAEARHTKDARFAELAPVLRAQLDRVAAARDPRLPSGLTHGDLFRDNVLWDEGGGISALLDFESASDGPYAYDLAVTMLAWCVGDELDGGLARALRSGYERVRPLSAPERLGLHAEAQFAALRFTITRITDYAMRPAPPGPHSVKDWSRFYGRFRALEAMGARGLLGLVGA